MGKFNNGKPYHGSDAVKSGRLKGATDTDYFYFFCPHCPGQEILRIIDFDVAKDATGNVYNDQLTSKANRTFRIAFKVHCENCGHTDFIKVSNEGKQCGQLG